MFQKYRKESLVTTYSMKGYLEGPIFAYGRMGCLDENTEIKVIDKKLINKKIKDLDNSFNVICRNKDTQKEEIKRAQKINSGKKNCLKITFNDGSFVIASEEHCFFTPYNKIIKVNELKVNDRLLKRF